MNAHPPEMSSSITALPPMADLELLSRILSSQADASTATAEQYQAMSDSDLEYELEDMLITDSCDAVRYVCESLNVLLLSLFNLYDPTLHCITSKMKNLQCHMTL